MLCGGNWKSYVFYVGYFKPRPIQTKDKYFLILPLVVVISYARPVVFDLENHVEDETTRMECFPQVFTMRLLRWYK